MTATLALILSISLATVPVVLVKIGQIQIDCFGHERARTYRAIQSLTGFIFLMSLVVDYSVDQVELLSSGVVGIADNGIQEEVKMILSGSTSIKNEEL